MLIYGHLSDEEKAPWRDLANRLLDEVPAPLVPDIGTYSIRGIALRRYLVRANLEAAVVYHRGPDWWGDVVIRLPNSLNQFGVPAHSPVGSEAEAQERIRCIIAGMPNVHTPDEADVRLSEAGIDFDHQTFLRVNTGRRIVEVIVPKDLMEDWDGVQIATAQLNKYKNVVKIVCAKNDCDWLFAVPQNCSSNELRAIGIVAAQGLLNID